MFPYEFYKVLHVFSIVLFFSYFSRAVVTKAPGKSEKIVTGVALILILVSGFGLLARLGIAQGSAWGTWVYVKMGIWLFVGALGHILMKRAPEALGKFYWVAMILLAVAALSANLKF